jgi:hypothetical protein
MIAPIYLQAGVALKALKRLVETGAIAEATLVFRAVSAERLNDGSIAA